MREIPSKCGSCGALFPCLPGVSSTAAEWRPRHCCERSRAAALSLDKAGDPNALLLCIVRGRNQGTGWRTYARDALYRLYGLSTLMTVTTPPRRLGAYLPLCFCQTRGRDLAGGSRLRIGCVYQRIARYVEDSELLGFLFLYILLAEGFESDNTEDTAGYRSSTWYACAVYTVRLLGLPSYSIASKVISTLIEFIYFFLKRIIFIFWLIIQYYLMRLCWLINLFLVLAIFCSNIIKYKFNFN